MVLVQLIVAFRRSLRVVALALCSMAIIAVASPASARSHHGAGLHARADHAGSHAPAPLPAYRSRIALGARRGAGAGARVYRGASQLWLG